MALHRLSRVVIGVPNAEETAAYYEDFGLEHRGDGRFASVEGGEQLEVVEAPYRRLERITLGADDATDLDRIATAVASLGVDTRRGDDRLEATDPDSGVVTVVQVERRVDLTAGSPEPVNGPGRVERKTARSAVIDRSEPVRPRRLGHVVFASTDQARSETFFRDGIGLKVSDAVPGLATFFRCSTDHHNVLVQQGPVPYLHHTSWEVEDIDEIGRGAMALLADHPERHLWGLGRHHIGSNFFWYFKDPAGNYSEYYADMDCILDDDAWVAQVFGDEHGLYSWGPPPPATFLDPADMAQLVSAIGN